MGLRQSRAGSLLLVAVVAVASYANTLGNEWAYDDDAIVASNDVVRESRWSEIFGGAYWHDADTRPALYRPTTVAALALEWRLFGGSPAGFHAVNVVLHTAVSLLATALVGSLVGWGAAAVGGVIFAVHPVHVEAVANVVGQGELIAALGYLAACLVYLRPGSGRPGGARIARVLVIGGLYALALGAKEIAATLPAALLALGLIAGPSRDDGREPTWSERTRGVAADAPLFVLLGAILVAFLGLRVWILGSVPGERPAAEMAALTSVERVLTGLSVWPTYLRLLVAPLDLAADYGPGIHRPATGLRADVLAGALMIAALVAVVAAFWRRAPWAALAAAWFLVAILPVSNLILAAGTMLAERTLYLPSFAISLAAAGAGAAALARWPERRSVLGVGFVVVAAALMVRTVLRNPTWLSSYTMLNTLALEHPESWLGRRSRAHGLAYVGQHDAAFAEYEAALELQPLHYGLLTEMGMVYKERRQLDRAIELLDRAVAVDPLRPTAYRLLAEAHLLAGDGRSAHRTALAGLSSWGRDRELWALVSESYIAKGDLPAAIRAREAAIAVEPTSRRDWQRLGELLEASGHAERAGAARRRAAALPTPAPRAADADAFLPGGGR